MIKEKDCVLHHLLLSLCRLANLPDNRVFVLQPIALSVGHPPLIVFTFKTLQNHAWQISMLPDFIIELA